MKFISIALVTLFVCNCVATSETHGQIVRKAGQFLTGKMFKESGKQGTKLLLRKSSSQLTKLAARSGGKAIVKGAAAKTGVLITRYGDDATRALAKLSPKSSRRLAILGGNIGPEGSKLMKLIAKRGDGDKIVAWLWRNKATISGGAVLATFVMNPDPFLSAAENVATELTHTTGEFVVEPIVEHIAKPLALWLGFVVFIFGLGGGLYFVITMKLYRRFQANG